MRGTRGGFFFFFFSDCDAYINIAGGMRINEPAIDLGIVLAIISCKKDIVVPSNVICFGEVGLSGEVRGVSLAEQRIAEAKRLGFEICILPKVCMNNNYELENLKLIGVSNIMEAKNAIERIGRKNQTI